MHFCDQCGTQLDDSLTFCITCGAKQPPVYTTNPNYHTYSAPKPDHKRILKRILWIAIPIVVLAIGFIIVFGLISNSPAVKFSRSVNAFFTDFAEVQGDEINARLKKEPYDMSAKVDLSSLSELTDGQLENASLNYDLKKNGQEQGMTASLSVGGAEMFKLTGIILSDKLLAGLSIAGSTKAATIDLPGKPTDPLKERLQMLFSTSNVKNSNIKNVVNKTRQYLQQSIDLSWFETQNDSLTNAVTDQPMNTNTVVLRLNNERIKELLTRLADKFDKDPTFYDELDNYIVNSNPDIINVDSRKQIGDALKNAVNNMPEENIEFCVKIHLSGSAPVALQFSLDVGGDDGFSFDIVLQKNIVQNKTVYKGEIKLDRENSLLPDLDMDIKCDIEKVNEGFTYHFIATANSEGNTFKISLDGKSNINKQSSDQYIVDAAVTVGWEIPEIAEESSIDFAIKETYAFNSQIQPIKDDDHYAYNELNADAKEFTDPKYFLTYLTSGLTSGSLQKPTIDFSWKIDFI